MTYHPFPAGRRTLAGLLIMILATLCAAPAAQAEQAVHFDRWFVILLEGERMGWAHMRLTEQDGQFISASESSFTIRRGFMTVSMRQQSRFVETADGRPIEASSVMLAGQMEQKQTLRFTEDGAVFTTEQAGQVRTQQLPPFEEGWLTPVAAERYVEERIAAGDEQIQFRSLDLASAPRPFDTTLRRLGEQQVEVFGRVVPALAWEAELSILPGIRTVGYVDDQGRPLKTTLAMGPGMEIVVLAADRELALSRFDPPEMLAAMFISPDRPLPNPRTLRSAVYRLRFDDSLPADQLRLPRAGYQRVSWGDERTAVVAVDLNDPVNPMDDLPTAADRAASSMIDHEDPKVRELLARALGQDGDGLSDAQKAERLRQFVAAFIDQKDLSVGLGTASEVARTAQGDCTEHAVLLAALLRAADIPARTATGLVYVDEFIGSRNVFGGHMWTQAWLPAEGGAGAGAGGDGGAGGHWVDLDAALGDEPFDATHITLAVSAMADDEMTNDLVALVPLLGGLTIEVVDVGGQ